MKLHLLRFLVKFNITHRIHHMKVIFQVMLRHKINDRNKNKSPSAHTNEVWQCDDDDVSNMFCLWLKRMCSFICTCVRV